MGIGLYPFQIESINEMHNGCILCGKTGLGKSRTSLGYYFVEQGGGKDFLADSTEGAYMKDPLDLYIITTAKKRDTKEWDNEISLFLMSTDPKANHYKNKVVIDSWNNVKKYKDVKGAFFIFDEQKASGRGVWSRIFRVIAKHNKWIMLSATPGDKWTDYISVFIANGFYRNISEFNDMHVTYLPTHTTYPVIDENHYRGETLLNHYRTKILVDMNGKHRAEQIMEDIRCDYDRALYRMATRRWNPYTDAPIENISQLCKIWQRIVFSDESRQKALMDLLNTKNIRKAIIFYNYNFELDILRNLFNDTDYTVAEWNGQKHEDIPETPKWIYLVNYMGGSEGWNCIQTDTVIFYSLNYSWRIMEQAKGRISRINTPFDKLYFYRFISKAPIDLAIKNALVRKKIFNESAFARKLQPYK